MSRKRVLIAYTGGTIGMRRSPAGYAPAPGFLAEYLATEERLHAVGMPELEVLEFDPLLDSANMTPAHWTAIARAIERRYDDFDGFLVLHGTDTMAYTASALPFMLEGLGKPVILTGAQLPLTEVRSDGRSNLITALVIAADHPIPEVCLYFRGRLLRGCRAVKTDADGFQAFDSPGFPTLGAVGVDIGIRHDLVLPPPPAGTLLRVHDLDPPPAVAALRLFPGISAEIVRNVLRHPLRGLVLQCYGTGNGPSHDTELLAALREAVDRGVTIVATSQCVRGTVRLRSYATGNALADAGVISGADITDEAALAKLCFLLSCGHGPDEVARRMTRSLRGEIGPAPGPPRARDALSAEA